MKKEIARDLEKSHNVHIDHEVDMMTKGDRSDVYGWAPVPAEWRRIYEEGGE